METLQCIETRRSIRRFKDKPIEKDTIEKLVKEAQYAPTWKNSQTSRFTAVTDKEILKEICTALPDFNAAIVNNAPMLMAVSALTKRSGYERDGSPTTIYGEAYTYFDCGLTVQTLCLAAHDLGIGTVILGIFDPNRVKAMLQIPDNEDLLVLVACGYHEAEVQAPKRRELNEILRIL